MMLTITDGGSLSRALSTSIDPAMKRLLIECTHQLSGEVAGNARFIVVQPGDVLKTLERKLGWVR